MRRVDHHHVSVSHRVCIVSSRQLAISGVINKTIGAELTLPVWGVSLEG